MARFYKCDVCERVVAELNPGSGPLICCGQDMNELKPGTVDASHEKHVPVVTTKGTCVSVQVGSVLHPMEKEHFIEWICLKTDRGFQLKYLTIGSSPVCNFYVEDGEKPVKVYAYCNIHGLWAAEMN